ncbi:DUF5985 family protein [Noviherbaspirillum massiliense]|uniref:DUF5985 family protein n=1 Tax=Noviherbaspirillum massiliense TaxID=1465823 RepID=UPI00037F0242|nr:DUF5985 family protein [Noviherbaspirillum massiliense]
MAGLIYSLCALTAFACAFLILRSYIRHRHRLLLWSGLCFVGMAANNLLLVIDRLLVPGTDLSIWRLGTALAALLPLLYGLIWEEE